MAPGFLDWLHGQYADFSAQRAEAIERMKSAEGDDFLKASAEFDLHHRHCEEVNAAIRVFARYTASAGGAS